ncbi:MAG: alpha/beta hydrolase [Acidobacteria bacterium]|nr:alpha/beta hydrolase [Acidobacteriota bacterium]
MSREILTLPPPPADTRVAYGTDPSQFADLRLPNAPGPHPVIVVIHGGFWRAAYDLVYAGHMSAALSARGFATWNIEYRRIGQPGGGWPGTLDDVAAAVDHLRTIAPEHKLDLRRVIAVGHSAGGHLALWLASRNNPKVKLTAAVSLAGVSDLRDAFQRRLGNGVVADLMGGSPDDLDAPYRAASPLEHLPLRIPTRLIHGDRDDIVPSAMSQAYARAAANAGDDAQAVILPGAGHFELVDTRTPEWRHIETIIVNLRKP